MDLERYAVPNSFLLISLLAGIVLTVWADGAIEGILHIGACVFLTALLFPLFAVHVLGAGDIKLFAVVGSFYGLSFGVSCIMAAFVLGGFMSIWKMMKQKELKQRVLWVLKWIQGIRQTKKLSAYPCYSKQYEQDTIHFTWAILGGFFVTII